MHLVRADAVESCSRVELRGAVVKSSEGNSKGQEQKSWLYPCRMGLAHYSNS